MKNLRNYIVWLMVLFVSNTLYGQSPDAKGITDDLHTRLPGTQGTVFVWELNQYGYKSTYTITNQDFITWYSRDGNYLETLLKTNWDDRVPAILKMELGVSDFNTCTVDRYWVSVNTRNDSYFLELTDRDGKSQNVWADENGKLSKVPVFMR